MDNSTGQWTTPDAFAGDVHDPMSQKAFVWNRNNPYQYSDPSGYRPGVLDASNHDLDRGWGTASWWDKQNDNDASNDAAGASPGDDYNTDLAYFPARPKKHPEKPPTRGPKKQETKKSGKEMSSERPSWVANMSNSEPQAGETGDAYARRMLDAKYQEGDPRRAAKGGGSEYNQLTKWFARKWRPSHPSGGQ